MPENCSYKDCPLAPRVEALEDAKLLSGAPEDLLRRDELAAVLGRAGLV